MSQTFFLIEDFANVDVFLGVFGDLAIAQKVDK